ncbi:MAG TPA: ATPase, T2SS/T4P/T4SS family [Patescibacteria group bacterium]|nr:ATPase, T2SS/T4P/T4SS family [Patescibacteria group bacterium]
MSDTNTTTNYYDFSNNLLSSQSILDVFVIQDLIDQADVDKLKGRFRTNREIENFLIKNRIVTKETINKAYSIVLKLPYVELANIEIPDELKSLIPEKLARKFGIIPFALQDDLIRIALSRPADLLVGFRSSLGKIFKEKKLEVELFITSESDFNECLKQYNKRYKSNTLLKKGRFPVVYLRNLAIPKESLDKIPRQFMAKYRIAVFGRNNRDYYMIACEQPDSPIILKILNFIKTENDIKFEIFATSKADIDYALDIVDGKPTVTKDNDAPAPEIETVPLAQKEAEEDPSTDSTSSPQADSTSSPHASSGQAPSTSQRTDLSTSFSSLRVKDKVGKAPGQESATKSAFRGLMENFINSSGPELTIDTVESNTEDLNKTGKTAAKTQKSVNNQEKPVLAINQKNTTDDVAKQPVVSDKSPISISAENKPDDNKPVETSDEKTEVAANPEAEPENGSESVSLLDNTNLGAWLDHEIKSDDDLVKFAQKNSVPKIVAAVIDYALNNRSSDIHVEPEAKMLRIRCRVDGILRDILKLPISQHPAFVSRIKIMSKLKIDEMRIPQDGRFDTIFNDREVDVRVSTLPTVHGEKIVMRVLDKSQGILSLEDLGMMGSAFDKTIAAIAKPYGIILSTGPTGSGKSTTLYAILNRISMPGVNIVTLEDPVEYEINGINQCQIKPDIGFTFASGLRSILRQDPNVIMVGEIRDAETAGMAVHAALTGHLVLSTLHTNDTAGALPRLINMGVEPFLITSSINLVVAQRLIRRICPQCKEEYKVPTRLMDQVKVELDKIPAVNTKDRARIPATLKLFHGKGCKECNQGFKGRVGIYEAMTMTPEIEDMASAKRPANEIKEATIKSGMIMMKQDGILKALAGETTIDEVYQAVITN